MIDDDAGEDWQDDLTVIPVIFEILNDPHVTNGPAKESIPCGFRESEAGELFRKGCGLFHRGRIAKALRKLHRAEAMARTKYGPKSPVVAWIRNWVGVSHLKLNRPAEAEAALREALAVREENLDADDPSIAVSLNNLGDTLGVQGRDAEAVPLLARAVDIESKAYGPDSRHTMLTRANLVEVLEGAGRKKEAIRELKKLRSGLKRHGDDLFGFGDLPDRVRDLSERLGV